MFRITCLILGSILMIACNDNGVTADPIEREWQATLVGQGDFAHLGGSSTVVVVAGLVGFEASATIEGDTPGAVRPWHVHFNSCAEGGGIVGTNLDYPRLEVGGDGTAEASVVITQPLQVGAAYHVNVHLSNEDLATIIACGDLVLTD